MRKPALVFVLILLPLAITAVIKYRPAGGSRISSVAVLRPNLIGAKEYIHLENAAAKRLHEALAEVPGLVVREAPDIPPTGNDLAQVLNRAGTDALIVPTLTVDAGIVQLNLQVIEAGTRRVIFNTPYQSSIDNFPAMLQAAAAALKRVLSDKNTLSGDGG